MAEQLDLTSPVIISKTTSDLRVVRVLMDWRLAHIGIVLESNHGELRSHAYDGEEARTMMIALNKANLSTISLHRRILNRLIADGKESGTVSGSPD